MTTPTGPQQLSDTALEGVTGGTGIGRTPGSGPSSQGVITPDSTGNDASQLIIGTFGNDTVDGGAGADRIMLLAGDDAAVIDDPGKDTVLGGEGNDTVTVYWLESGGGMHVDGGPGRDVLQLNFSEHLMTGEQPVIESDTSYKIVDGKLIFDGPASGTITWDGRTMTFAGIEAIEGGAIGGFRLPDVGSGGGGDTLLGGDHILD